MIERMASSQNAPRETTKRCREMCNVMVTKQRSNTALMNWNFLFSVME